MGCADSDVIRYTSYDPYTLERVDIKGLWAIKTCLVDVGFVLLEISKYILWKKG